MEINGLVLAIWLGLAFGLISMFVAWRHALRGVRQRLIRLHRAVEQAQTELDNDIVRMRAELTQTEPGRALLHMLANDVAGSAKAQRRAAEKPSFNQFLSGLFRSPVWTPVVVLLVAGVATTIYAPQLAPHVVPASQEVHLERQILEYKLTLQSIDAQLATPMAQTQVESLMAQKQSVLDHLEQAVQQQAALHETQHDRYDQTLALAITLVGGGALLVLLAPLFTLFTRIWRNRYGIAIDIDPTRSDHDPAG